LPQDSCSKNLVIWETVSTIAGFIQYKHSPDPRVAPMAAMLSKQWECPGWIQEWFKFVGKLNEDVCTYTWLGSRGYLFLTIPFAMVKPAGTQSMKGGISDLYKKVGTYVKTFYAVMYMPSAVKVAVMTTSHARVHHKVYWENCVPQILSEKWKKGGK